jgi:hypothetical protein
MKYILIILALVLSGCGLFSTSVPSVVDHMLTKAAERVAEEVGKELADIPMQCDFEIDHLDKKLLMLCEADLK